MSMLSSKSAVLFDLDGVLVDSRAPIARAVNHALRSLGLAPRPEPELHPRIGDSLHGIFAALLSEQGADPAGAPEAIARYREVYGELSLRETRLVPGIPQLLGALAGRPLAVATSKPLEFTVPILERLGIAGAFAAVAGPALSRTEGEPKVETARRALAALRLPPRSPAAMVGDRHHDVSAGRALGIASVGVTWGAGSEAELRGAGATWIVSTPAALGALLGAAHELPGAAT
jgi:phosphoglycolate phosphatase